MNRILSLAALLVSAAGCTIRYAQSSTTRTEYGNGDLYACRVEDETLRCHIRSACSDDQMAQEVADFIVMNHVGYYCPREWRETKRNPDAYVCRNLAFDALIEGICR